QHHIAKQHGHALRLKQAALAISRGRDEERPVPGLYVLRRGMPFGDADRVRKIIMRTAAAGSRIDLERLTARVNSLPRYVYGQANQTAGGAALPVLGPCLRLPDNGCPILARFARVG